jgi:hypothetical protein
MRGDTEQMDRRLPTSIANSTYSRRSDTVSTLKKSTASTPRAWDRRNCRQVTVDRFGAGSIRHA